MKHKLGIFNIFSGKGVGENIFSGKGVGEKPRYDATPEPSRPHTTTGTTSVVKTTTGTERNAFEQKLVEKQRKTLLDNMKKLHIPAEQQQKIMGKREGLPDNYHDMPTENPASCYWLLENTEVPDSNWRTRHHIEALKQCVSEISQEEDVELEAGESALPQIR